MKSIKKSDCPQELIQYIEKFPEAEWDSLYKEAKPVYQAIKKAVESDQKGICCYCEVDFIDLPDVNYVEDFRVEHFYPKSETPLPTGENAHLHWNNLLGACHGGAERVFSYINDTSLNHFRFTAPDLHCDAIKGDNNWVAVILNPLEINSNDKLFTFNSNGEILVHKDCPSTLTELANNTIKYLNLNQKTYLVRARKVVRDELMGQLELLLLDDDDIQIAINELKAIHLKEDEVIKFYSCKLDVLS